VTVAVALKVLLNRRRVATDAAGAEEGLGVGWAETGEMDAPDALNALA
jgi:hypothetical protein